MKEMFVSCTLGYLVDEIDCSQYMRPNFRSFGKKAIVQNSECNNVNDSDCTNNKVNYSFHTQLNIRHILPCRRENLDSVNIVVESYNFKNNLS